MIELDKLCNHFVIHTSFTTLLNGTPTSFDTLVELPLFKVYSGKVVQINRIRIKQKGFLVCGDSPRKVAGFIKGIA